MATRNLVPRATGEGNIGTDAKIWSELNVNKAYASNNIIIFTNVADMKASNKVKVGYTLKTLGYYSPNDGGGAEYIVVNDIGDEQPDDGSIIALQKKLYAIKQLYLDYKKDRPYCIGLSFGWDYSNIDLLTKFKNIGVKYIRIGVTWNGIEKIKNVYDFSPIESAVISMKNNGFIPYILLGYNNTLYADNTNDGIKTEENRIAFVNYAKATVEYFTSKGFNNLKIEIWNEPNIEGFWHDVNSNDYVTLVKSCYTEIKKVSSTTEIVAPAISTDTNIGNRNLWGSFFEQCLQYGLLDYVDFISLHLYTTENPEQYDFYIEKFEKTIRRYTNKDIKIIVSETGYSTYTGRNTEEERKKYLPRMILNNYTKNILVSLVFEATDTYTDENLENYFGLFNTSENYAYTDTALELQRIYTELNGHFFVKTLLKTKTACILLFANNFKFKIVYWTTLDLEYINFNNIILQATDVVSIKDVDLNYFLNKDNVSYKDTQSLTNFIGNDYMRNIIITGNKNAMLGANGTVTGSFNLIAGLDNTIQGSANSIAGQQNNIVGSYSLVSGFNNNVVDTSLCVGNTLNVGNKSLCSGVSNSTNDFSIVGGAYCESNNDYNLVCGQNLQANNSHMLVTGIFNSIRSQDDSVVIGNGTSIARTNAFRITNKGAVYGQSAYNSTGADYGEYFEWEDKNKNKEDRIGLFVTLIEDKIRIANADDYILGVISGTPCIIGNSYDDQWKDIYIKDDWGRIIYENINGNLIPKINSEYNSSEDYIARSDRIEWDVVGMLGVLTVKDDNSCIVNGFCTVSNGGIATSSINGYRVIKRVAPNIIKIIFK